MPKKFPNKVFLNIFTVITDNKTFSVNVEVDLKKCESRISAYCGNDKNDNFCIKKLYLLILMYLTECRVIWNV